MSLRTVTQRVSVNAARLAVPADAGAVKGVVLNGFGGLPVTITVRLPASGYGHVTTDVISIFPDLATVLGAGAIVDAGDARAALGAGADAVVAGSRFLLTHECHAHPAYQRRVAEASSTVITRLFGLGWRDPHRVVPNAAVRRWCAEDGSERRLARVLSSALLPAARRVPLSQAGRVVRAQRLTLPLFSPAPLLRGQDGRFADVTPLHAGAGVNRLTSVISAAEAVRRLTP